MSEKDTAPTPWTALDAARLYRFADWGKGYFGVSGAGNLQVHPDADEAVGFDLLEVVEGLASREIHTPVLLRFSGVLSNRLRRFRAVFDQAIEEAGYDGGYRLVYPIKVNQQRHVCEEIRDVGQELGFGFEVGAKPELIAALGLTADAPQMPIVCNGFKDVEYLELVVLASTLGRPITPVIERFEELETLLALAKKHDATPSIGVRARLTAQGSGRWQESAGARGKFGLSPSDLVRAVRLLAAEGRLGSLRLLHCHVGSQIREITAVKEVIGEIAHLYVELRRLGAPLDTLDVGGGLGVDYDGTRSATEASIDYALEEYAADLVYRIKDICDEADEPHPHIYSESGRAAVAYSSLLVVNVLGERRLGSSDAAAPWLQGEEGDDEPRVLREMRGCLESLRAGEDPVGVFHDASHARSESEDLFSLGHLSLEHRALCDEIFWTTSRALAASEEVLERIPDLQEILADQYYCNFSLFQSLPDSWAIDQRFPIAPIHRLDERPDRRAILGDITCDSDGRIEQFIGDEAPDRTLPVHGLSTGPSGVEPYYLGVFLVGAYQETLGDLHNLLGDTHAVHVVTDSDGSWEIHEVVDGDTTEEVLRYVQYDPDQIRSQIRRESERAIRSGHLTVPQARELRRAVDSGLRAYTYLHPVELEGIPPSDQPQERLPVPEEDVSRV